MFGRTPLWSSPVLKFCLLEALDYWIAVIKSVYSDYPFFLFILGRLSVSRNLSFLLGCPICWHITKVFSYDLCFCDIDYNSPFLFLMLSIWALYFLNEYQFCSYKEKRKYSCWVYSFSLCTLLFPSFCWL